MQTALPYLSHLHTHGLQNHCFKFAVLLSVEIKIQYETHLIAIGNKTKGVRCPNTSLPRTTATRTQRTRDNKL